MRLTLVLAFIASCAIGGTAVAQQTEITPFTTEDALSVVSLRVQDISDNGRYLLASKVTHRDRLNVDHLRFGDPTYISPSLGMVVVIDAETGEETQLFDEKVQIRSGTWSPDGSTAAFFLRDDDQYLLHTYDAARERVRHIRLKSDKAIASNSPLMWRPDGSGVLLALRDTSWAEDSRRMYLELSEGPVIVQDSREPFLAWDVVRGQGALMIPAIVDLQSRDVRELLPESRVTGFEQSDDGTFVTYTETTPLKTSYERNQGTEYQLFMLALDSLTPTALTEKDEDRVRPRWNDAGDAFAYGEEGNVFVRSVFADSAVNVTEDHRVPISEEDTTKLRFSLMRWKPDDAQLLLSSQQGWHVLDLETDAIELVYEEPEEEEGEENSPNVSVVSWSQDGHFLYATYAARDKWERGLVRLDLQNGELEDLVKDQNLYSGWQFPEASDRLFFQFSNGDLPSDLYAADRNFENRVRVTDLNPWITSRTLTRSELVEYLDVDGNTLYGILYYPVGYEEGKQYPLVAEIYERFFNNGFNSNMNLLANAGFFGFRPSVNLEIGYPGEAWLKGVTAGINSLIDRGLVDGDKLGVHGTSYGGYATNLLITQTNRFAAAINISGKVNIVSFLGDSPKITTRNYSAAEVGQDRIGATLWEQPQKYITHTAIMFADRIETPLLMLTGEGDWNVPATNQREMYYALRRLEKEVVWVHYMNAGHGAGRSSTVSDFHDHWQRVIDWYSTHFEETDESEP